MHNIGLYTGNMQSAYAIFKVVELSKLAQQSIQIHMTYINPKKRPIVSSMEVELD